MGPRPTTDGTYRVVVEKNVPCKMRDGKVLYSDVYRPDAEDKFPVLLMRTPYDKNNITSGIGFQIHPVHAAERGYVVLMQDVRGMFTSEGTFDALNQEANDGYDTIKWAAGLPYSSGKVGMFGGSYTGVTQILAAMSKPPELMAITPRQTTANYYRGWAYQDGALLLGFDILWTITLCMGELASAKLPPEEKARQRKALALASDRFREVSSRLPLEKANVFEVLGRAPYFREWLDHPSYDQYWAKTDATKHFAEMSVSGLHIAGWYDVFLRGTLENFAGMLTSGKPQKLVIGPWLHGTDLASRIGEWDSGYESQGSVLGIEAMQLRWFDHWLKGIENDVDKGPPVLVYVMGENRWREENEWPLARTVYTKYYLQSAGHANSLVGDGTLVTEPPKTEQRDIFVYDPMNPVPTKGGATTGTYPAALNDGVLDQQDIERRYDVLVYTTPVLERDTEVTGPVRLTLFASSSQVDTDYTGKLVDVRPDGYARIICDGIIRGRYRESFERPKPLIPGIALGFYIDLTATSMLFERGHRIRLEVSSSNFPKYDRNLNTGSDYSRDPEVKTALQTVFHGPERPSCLTLPIIPRA